MPLVASLAHIKGERGLGDSIYLYPIVKAFLDNHNTGIVVHSNYPEVFSDLNCPVVPFLSDIEDQETKLFSYLPYKSNENTSLIEDITSLCPYEISFNKTHRIKNHNLIKNILLNKKNSQKICIVRYIEPRHNRNTIDNLDCSPSLINKFISEYSKTYYFIGIGQSNYYNIKCDMDLMNRTSISDLFDLAFISNLVIGQAGYTVPLCEILHRYNIAIFPSVWKNSHSFLKTITPKKICGPHTGFVYDDDTIDNIIPPRHLRSQLKNINTKKTKTITLNVPQGVGDILWIYQKFCNHIDRINFNIIVTQYQYNENSKLRDRSVNFLKLLDKVGDINLIIKSSDYYHRVANTRYSMESILENNRGPQDYSCNLALEQNTRIEDIDPNYTVNHNIHINHDHQNLTIKNQTKQKYIVLYVSGSTLIPTVQAKHSLWSVQEWCKFLDKFFNNNQLSAQDYTVVLIGANYDSDVIARIRDILRQKYSILTFIDLDPFNLVALIKEAFYFIGYQSGLNVIADIYNVPQIMIYFPYLQNMLYSWCKKEHIKSIFFATTFKDDPETAAEKHRTLLLSNN